MKLFFTIVAGMLVGFLLIVLALYIILRFGLKWYFNRLLRRAKATHDQVNPPFTQPFRIHLRKLADHVWTEQDEVERLCKKLHEAGFIDASFFEVAEVRGFFLQALLNSETGVTAVVYEQTPRGVWLDLVSKYEDGTLYTSTTAPESGLDRPAHSPMERYDRAIDPLDIYHQHLGQRPQHVLKVISIDDFAKNFEHCYAEEMDWRVERGGFSEAEVRSVFMHLKQDVTDDQVLQVHTMRQLEVQGWLQLKLKERVREKVNLSNSKWQEIEHRLIYIHDRMSAGEAQDAFEELEGFDEDEDGTNWEVPLPNTNSARELFAQQIETLPAKRKPKKIVHLNRPVPTDVYLRPELDDDE